MGNLKTLAACAALALVAPAAANAAFTYHAPSGLAPGSHYVLAFVTTGTIDATSPNITTYNDFVQSEAALSPSLPATTWMPLVSTSDSSVFQAFFNNCLECLSAPVYLITEERVATTEVAIFNVVSHPVLHAINVTQDGEAKLTPTGSPIAWTGTDFAFNSVTRQMGSSAPFVGNYQRADSLLVQVGAKPTSLHLPLYAFSGLLTAPASVPEPATWALMLAGLVAVGTAMRRRTLVAT